MPSTPTVTVVTPAYNVGKYIGETVKSVMSQTYENYEYLVIDDGSTDDSAAIATAAAAGNERFRLVKGEHKGLSPARNLGIREARGKYIAYLDGDDTWYPKFLENQVALLESIPADVGLVFCRSRMVLENGLPIFVQRSRPGPYNFEQFLIAHNPARNGSSLLIKRSCFEDVGGFDETLNFAEDFEMWLRIAEGSKTPVLWANKQTLTRLRLRPGSMTRDRSTAEATLDTFLATQAAKVSLRASALAYVIPAAAALKYGNADTNQELTDRWTALARKAGIRHLLRSPNGARFLFWSSMSPSQRATVKRLQKSTRNFVKAISGRIRPIPTAPPQSPPTDV